MTGSQGRRYKNMLHEGVTAHQSIPCKILLLLLQSCNLEERVSIAILRFILLISRIRIGHYLVLTGHDISITNKIPEHEKNGKRIKVNHS